MESDYINPFADDLSDSLEKKVNFQPTDDTTTYTTMTNSATSIGTVEEAPLKRSASDCMPSHESLKAWDEARRAREVNEQAIVEVMFANMESRISFGKGACSELLNYIKEVARCQHKFVKSYGKLSNTLDERLHYGTLENACVYLKMHNINSCSIYEEHNKILSENIALQFSQLVTDYSKQGDKILEFAKKIGKDYEDAREKTDKTYYAYLTAFEEHVSAEKSGVIPPKDAWMAEKVYNESIQVLAVEQDKYSTELEQVFERFLALEEKRIESTKDVLHLHVQKQKLILGKLMEGICGFGDSVESIDTTADRQLLIKQNFDRKAISATHLQKLLLQIQQAKLALQQVAPGSRHAAQQGAQLAAMQQQSRELKKQQGTRSRAASDGTEQPQISQEYSPISKQRSLSTLDRPRGSPAFDKARSLSTLERPARTLNFGFRSSMEITEPPPSVMAPAKTGFLFRKSKIMKSWKQTHCILTSSGFLYIYSSKEKPTPKYVVPLKDVAVHPLPEMEEPNVFELIANKDSFFGHTKFLLQAESKEALAEWVDTIKTYSGSKK